MVKEKTESRRDAARHLRGFARDMRRLPTETERKFWQVVRDRRFCGYKFKRQVPIGNYIADFVCLERKLIVEIDGGEHERKQRYDQVREARLSALRFRVVRFWNYEVNADMESVLLVLKQALDIGTPSP